MLNLTPHHRIHIPNGLAMLAAVLLFVSSVVGFTAGSSVDSSSMDATPSIKVESVESDRVEDAIENKRRNLSLNFLLFRRG